MFTRFEPVESRSLPAVAFSGLDGVKSSRSSDLYAGSDKSASPNPGWHCDVTTETGAGARSDGFGDADVGQHYVGFIGLSGQRRVGADE